MFYTSSISFGLLYVLFIIVDGPYFYSSIYSCIWFFDIYLLRYICLMTHPDTCVLNTIDQWRRYWLIAILHSTLAAYATFCCYSSLKIFIGTVFFFTSQFYDSHDIIGLKQFLHLWELVLLLLIYYLYYCSFSWWSPFLQKNI